MRYLAAGEGNFSTAMWGMVAERSQSVRGNLGARYVLRPCASRVRTPRSRSRANTVVPSTFIRPPIRANDQPAS